MKNFNQLSPIFGYSDKFSITGDNRHNTTGEVWHGILYGLAGMAWYMIWPGEVCGNAYVNFMFYGIALGYGLVHMWRSCSHVQLLITLGSDSKLRDCEYIYITVLG